MSRFLSFLAGLLAAGGLALAPAPVHAAIDEDDLLPIDEAFALQARAVERGRIEFTWTIADGYYLYRHRTKVAAADASFKTNPLQLPDGQRHTDEFFGEVETYRGSLTAVQTGAAASGVATVTFRVGYQGCADVGVCYPPHTKTVTVALPPEGAAGDRDPLPGRSVDDALSALGGGPGTGAAIAGDRVPLPEDQAFGFEAIVDTPERLLVRFSPAPGYYLYRDRTDVVVSGAGVEAGALQWPAAVAHRDEHFGDVQVYFEPVDVPLPLRRTAAAPTTVTVTATLQGCQDDGICYPPMTRTATLALPEAGTVSAPADAPRETPPAAVSRPLWLVLLFAFGGGVILNLFPCVLPVLSLKALSLAQGGAGVGTARRQALWYTAGVLASFVAVGAIALALRQGGLALGWGFQLQQPGVVAALALVMIAIGLSLSGVVAFGASLAGAGQSLTEKSGAAGDFFTGVLAVVVATPCTAPMMGAALAYAFTASSATALLVFVALGLGLAAPFLLIGFVPAVATRLPKPGAWMETLKQVLAYPMYLTAVWLLWVLAKQRGADAIAAVLVGAVLLAAGLWAWEKARWKGLAAKGFAALLVVVALWPVVVVQRMPPPPRPGAEAAEPGVVAFSPDRLAQLRRDGRVVFVNMTADWCVTCKANEKTVLGTDAFRAALDDAGAVYMKGDWTDVDPTITAFLEEHGAVGVPLYVVYPASGDPVVLPTVLTRDLVERALGDASGTR